MKDGMEKRKIFSKTGFSGLQIYSKIIFTIYKNKTTRRGCTKPLFTSRKNIKQSGQYDYRLW
jgi:hypothetical protein